MKSRKIIKTLAEITFVGPDKKGVVALVTRIIFESKGNIESINQNVVQGLFGMFLEATFRTDQLNEKQFRKSLNRLGQDLKMEVKLHP